MDSCFDPKNCRPGDADDASYVTGTLLFVGGGYTAM